MTVRIMTYTGVNTGSTVANETTIRVLFAHTNLNIPPSSTAVRNLHLIPKTHFT